MKTKNIIACLFLLIATQAVSAQNNAEMIIRLLINQMKSHKNVEMTFNYQISPDEKTVIEGQKATHGCKAKPTRWNLPTNTPSATARPFGPISLEMRK